MITSLLPAKPRYGQPCNGCGLCCAMEPCQLARELLDCHAGPCTALEHDAERTFCGLVRRPAHYLFNETVPAADTAPVSVLFAGMLGLGHGCDADDPA